MQSSRTPVRMALGDVCQHYVDHLGLRRRTELACITSLSNGFEGWLKFEFCIMCGQHTRWHCGSCQYQ